MIVTAPELGGGVGTIMYSWQSGRLTTTTFLGGSFFAALLGLALAFFRLAGSSGSSLLTKEQPQIRPCAAVQPLGSQAPLLHACGNTILTGPAPRASSKRTR